MNLWFANKSRPFNRSNFLKKIDRAIVKINENTSLEARATIEKINSQSVTLNSFFDLTYDDYLKIRDFLSDSHLRLPNRFPPGDLAVRHIETKLCGIVFVESGTIYLNSEQTSDQLALTIVHEVFHFLNQEVTELEQETLSREQSLFRDEMRSFIAEYNFVYPRLTRGSLAKLQQQVETAYPELTP